MRGGGGPFSSVFTGIISCVQFAAELSGHMPSACSLSELSFPEEKILRSVRGCRGEECHRCSGLGSAVHHTTFLIYLLAVVSLHCCMWALLLKRARAPLPCNVWASHCGSCSRVQASVVAARGL